jgi:hypothetical protein
VWLWWGHAWWDRVRLQAVYEYGTGLSYTTFQYSTSTPQLQVPLGNVQRFLRTAGKHVYFRESAEAEDYITVTVTNTGTVAGSDVVQVGACWRGGAGERGQARTTQAWVVVGLVWVYCSLWGPRCLSRHPHPAWAATPSNRLSALSASSCSPANPPPFRLLA